MIDPVALAYSLLTSDTTSTLYSLVGKRVWSPVAPQTYRNAQPAIVFSAFADMHVGAASVIEVRLLFKCYGGSDTYSDARSVARALITLLDGKRTSIFHFIEVTDTQEYNSDVYPCYVVQARALCRDSGGT